MAQQLQIELKKAESKDWNSMLSLYSSLDKDDKEYRFSEYTMCSLTRRAIR